MQSLKAKTVKGVWWSAADAFLGQGMTFLVGLVLARLLSPDEYGLIGIVTIFTTILLGFVDSGFSNALIRKHDVSDDDYSTLFYFNLFVSIIMYALLYVGAPTIAIFFDRIQLISLTRVIGLLLVFQALSIVQYTILSRRIDFKTKTKASVISALFSGVIGIGMALSECGVWSLVAQLLSRQLTYSICLWLLNKWWPKLKFSIKSFMYMWGFGWKLLLSGFLDRVWAQLYQAVVGKYYSPSTLGQYTKASEFANVFSSNFTSIIQRVSFPALSQVQDEKERLIFGYRKVIKTTMFVTTIILFFLGAVSKPLIYCMIGPQWNEAATYLPLICISMSLYPLHAINLNMLQVLGRTDIFLCIEIIKKVIALLPLYLGIFVNIYWMLIATIIIGIIAFFLNSFYTGKSLGYTSWHQIKDVSPSFGVAIIIAMSVFFLKNLPVSTWIILPVQIVVGVTVGYLFCEKLQLEEYKEVKYIVKKLFQNLKLK